MTRFTIEQHICSNPIPSDRLIDGRYFERLSAFSLFDFKRHWNERKFYSFLQSGVTVPKAHVIWNPLHAFNGRLYQPLYTSLLSFEERQYRRYAI